MTTREDMSREQLLDLVRELEHQQLERDRLEPIISWVQILRVQKDDTLVIRGGRIDQDIGKALKAKLAERGLDVTVVALPEGADLTVLRKAMDLGREMKPMFGAGAAGTLAVNALVPPRSSQNE